MKNQGMDPTTKTKHQTGRFRHACCGAQKSETPGNICSGSVHRLDYQIPPFRVEDRDSLNFRIESLEITIGLS